MYTFVVASASTTADTFVDTTYQDDFMKRMNQMRLAARHTDVTLQTGNVKITCHRAILATATEYFDTMFTCGLEESTSPVVQLTMEPDTLSSIVEYVYTGVIQLTDDNVECLVKACDHLHLNSLKAACDKFMLKHVEPANCVGFYQFAKMYRIDELKQKAMQVMCAQFKSVAHREEFKHLSCDELIHLIKQNDVDVESEDIVCESVLDWVRQDLENRRSAFDTIIEYVRLPYCSSTYLWHTKDTSDLLTPKFLQYLDEALKFHTGSVHRYEMSSCRTLPRNNFQRSSCLLVFGNKNLTTQQYDHYHGARAYTTTKPYCCSYYYKEVSKQWVQLMNPCTPIDASCTFSLCGTERGHLLRDGGNCWLLHLTTKREESMPCSNARYHDGSVSLGNCVYVVGGKEGKDVQTKELSSATCLRLEERRWVPLPDMPRAVAYPMVVTCNNKIYMVGGTVQGNAVSCIQVFDTTWGKWCNRSEMPEACTGCAAVVLNNSIYVVGGNKRRCLKYDTSLDSWTKLTPPFRSHAKTAAVVWRGRILVATRGAALSTETCEQYTPANDTWSDWTTSFDAKVMDSVICHSLFNVDLSHLP